MRNYAMNRGHGGEEIFYGNKNKSQFLDFLVDASKKMKIRIFDLVDAEFVNELFGTKEQLITAIQTWGVRELPDQSKGNRRKKDRYFDPVGKVIWEFEKIKGIKIDDIDISTKEGTQQRGDLLVMLKENGGLTYKEISELDIFEDIKMDSLRSIYRNAKKRRGKN